MCTVECNVPSLCATPRSFTCPVLFPSSSITSKSSIDFPLSATYSSTSDLLYTSFKEKNSSSSSIRRKKILSPSHRFRSFIFSFSTHSRIPSSHSIGSPVNPSAVYSDIYSTTSSPYTNVTIPLYFQEVNI